MEYNNENTTKNPMSSSDRHTQIVSKETLHMERYEWETVEK